MFDKRSVRDGSGKANVRPDPGSEVWGVIYSVPDRSMAELDRGEGRGYRRELMSIARADGSTCEAWVYVATQPDADPDLRPYSWYMKFLVEGAREHGLPADYIQRLERIDAVEDPDHERNRRKRALGDPAG